MLTFALDCVIFSITRVFIKIYYETMKFLKLTFIIAVVASMMMTSCDSGSKSTDKYSFSFDVPEDVSYNIGILFFGSNMKRMNIRSSNN